MHSILSRPDNIPSLLAQVSATGAKLARLFVRGGEYTHQLRASLDPPPWH